MKKKNNYEVTSCNEAGKSGMKCCEPAVKELPHTIILDCSTVAFIDLAGVKTLKQVRYCRAFSTRERKKTVFL